MPGPRLRDRVPHVYTSTACLHEQHAECKRACKFCHAACTCPCHVVDVDAPTLRVLSEAG